MEAAQATPRFSGPDPRKSPHATVRAVLGEAEATGPRLPDGRNIFGRVYP